MKSDILISIKWSFFSELIVKVIQPLVFIILAKLLTPVDYGVVAAATMVLSFSQIFWDAGISKAVIQSQDSTGSIATTAFWLNVILGIVVASVLIIFSDSIASIIFKDDRVSLVLKFLTIQLLLTAASSIHVALLQKEMQFSKLFWVRIFTVVLPALVSIPLALRGFGYWALVGGSIAGQFVQLCLLWYMNEWRPHFKIETQNIRQLLTFGYWVTLTGLMAWFYMWADSLIVSMYLGPAEMGMYRVGNQFIGMIFGLLFAPVLPVLYSYFAKNAEMSRVQAILTKCIGYIIIIALPIAFFLFTVSSNIEITIFGKKWTGIGNVISILSLGQGLAWVVGMNGEAFRAVGKPEYETTILFGSFVIYLVGYIVSIRYGLTIFLGTRLILTIVGTVAHLLVIKYLFKINIFNIIGDIAKVSLFGLPIVMVLKKHPLLPQFPALDMALIGIIIFAYFSAYLVLFERNKRFSELVNLFKGGFFNLQK